MPQALTVADLLKRAHSALSPAERRISRVLLADYPVAGLESVQSLAKRANVSAPTVLRLLVKLEIGSYPEMQKMLREEISARNTSPLLMYSERGASSALADTDGLPFVWDYRRMMNKRLEMTYDSLHESELLEIVQLLANQKYGVWAVGGRFSDVLAQYLILHLKLLRQGAQHVGLSESEVSFALMDFSSKDLVIAFDYRRYQAKTVDFLREAKRRKAVTVLFTDPWLSPAAKFSDYVLSSQVASASPFDSLTPAFALVETLVAGLVDELGDEPKQRIANFDELQGRALYARDDPGAPDRSQPSSTRRTR